MEEKYAPLISVLIGAFVGAGTSLITLRIQLRHWLTQQRWSNREKHYVDLLANLTKLKLSLEDRSEYFREPGSEHDMSVDDKLQFKVLSKTGGKALQAIREQLGVAAAFLSQDATNALATMVRELWNTAEDAVCTADYVNSALKLVNIAYSKVLPQARAELGKP